MSNYTPPWDPWVLSHPQPCPALLLPNLFRKSLHEGSPILGVLAPWEIPSHSLLVLLLDSPTLTALRPLLPPFSPLGHLSLTSHRFLFQHWGHWMDWSLAFLLVISLLVTYASLLLVGLGTAGLPLPPQPSLPSTQLYPLATEGRGGGVSAWEAHPSDPSWHLLTPHCFCHQLLALLLWLRGQPLHLHSIHKVEWGCKGAGEGPLGPVPVLLLAENLSILSQDLSSAPEQGKRMSLGMGVVLFS